MQTFYLKTFGCKTNQYEEQGMREALFARGWQEASSLVEAEVLILNTCTVTGQASNHCRRFTGQALRANPALRLILTGCAADACDDWQAEFPFEAVFTNTQKAGLVAYLTGESSSSAPATDGDGFAFSLQRFTGHTRAFLKIQDGCANFCTYCIIPAVRGVPRSRSLPAILQEARQLLTHGYTELVLTGINIGEYQRDGLRLAGLARELVRLPGLHRLRLGSVEPQTVTPELLQVMQEEPLLCPHLHLPLQSGDDVILRAMNRHYATADFLHALDRVRSALIRPAITTDVIVGFPGEDEASFARTCVLIKNAGFARGHIFNFSPRQNTPAAVLHHQRPCLRKIVEARHRELTAICEKTAGAYAESLCGRQDTVMLEYKSPEGWAGYCSRYLRTVISGEKDLLRRGACVPVVITGRKASGLLAEVSEGRGIS